MNIYGKKVMLRAIEMKDRELITSLFNSPEIESKVVGWAFPVSELSQEKWLNVNYNDSLNQRYIIETDKGEAVGVITITNIDWKNRSATHGIKILKDCNKKQGIGTDAVMAIQRYAFDELGLHRLNSTILCDNEASINLYKKCGWKIEGTRKSSIYKNGQWKDQLFIGILENEYRDLVKENNYWK